jgi:hypothetical protein
MAIMFSVLIKKKTLKDVEKLPLSVQQRLAESLNDLRSKGPVQSQWPNYSKLGKDAYHCHLSRKWVACRHHENKSLVIEVYYAGSRENAPY